MQGHENKQRNGKDVKGNEKKRERNRRTSKETLREGEMLVNETS